MRFIVLWWDYWIILVRIFVACTHWCWRRARQAWLCVMKSETRHMLATSAPGTAIIALDTAAPLTAFPSSFIQQPMSHAHVHSSIAKHLQLAAQLNLNHSDTLESISCNLGPTVLICVVPLGLQLSSLTQCHPQPPGFLSTATATAAAQLPCTMVGFWPRLIYPFHFPGGGAPVCLPGTGSWSSHGTWNCLLRSFSHIHSASIKCKYPWALQFRKPV